ncbi:MAG TPA: tRNA lysidine(34) synthetase TilS [Candidatus Saccharimonadales bacterium]
MFLNDGDSAVRYLLAVSGGVDSVVLLDKMVQESKHELIVAHFDHGIRPESADDARFVEGLAKKYGLPFVGKREELGQGTGEDLARRRRYAFLRSEAKKRNAQLVTAHHADDVIETIAINIVRGTGWRGVAVLAAPDIMRPLIHLPKRELYAYALANNLEWVEDGTNRTGVYLRNRIRYLTPLLSSRQKSQLIQLRDRQVELAGLIEAELKAFITSPSHSRYFYTQLDTPTARELLGGAVRQVKGAGLTRPQLERALLAIKTARPSSVYEAGNGVTLQFTARSFIVKAPREML